MSTRALRFKRRELINIEKIKQNEKKVIEDTVVKNVDKNASIVPAKRKRGRPKNVISSEQKELLLEEKTGIVNTEPLQTCSEDNVPKKKQRITSINTEVAHSEDSVPRRKPRMAGLNALAKVNAVFECYRFEPKKDMQLQTLEVAKSPKNVTLKDESDLVEVVISPRKFSEKQENYSENLDTVFDTDKNNDACTENIKVQDVKLVQSREEDIKGSNASSNSLNEQIENESQVAELEKVISIDQAVQTDVFHKCVQTETFNFPNIESCMLCTCKSEKNLLFSYYSPKSDTNYCSCPIYVKSNILAHTESHTLAVPIIKKHEAWTNIKQPLADHSNLKSEAISSLVDQCITNTFLQSSFPCSKLVYYASYKHSDLKTELNKPKVKKKKIKDSEKKNEIKHSLLVPTIKCDVSKGTENKKSIVTLKKTRGISGNKLTCNGWKFEGKSTEETYKQGNENIKRLYYQGVSRNNEVIRVSDAVVLQSGQEKDDTDYIARVSSFWEDKSGVHAGETMMSVYWYYKPEQINNKCADFKGKEMEVLASHHQDDNSVACIVDKCYVVTYAQYCRFRSQRRLFEERRKEKVSVVPESKNNNSRLVPSPDVDKSSVFFCRYWYDYRYGKIVKNV